MRTRGLWVLSITLFACSESTSRTPAPANAEAPVPEAPAQPEVVGGTERADRERKCDAGDAASCRILGMLLAHGEGARARVAETIEALTKACDGADAEACKYLTFVLGHEGVTPVDEARELQLLLRACELGERDACDSAAYQVDDKVRAEELKTRALELAKTECERGTASACRDLASFDQSAGGDPLRQRAYDLARKECERGVAVGCYHVGEAYRRGGRYDLNQAFEWYRRAAAIYQAACEQGDGEACERLGRMAEEGEGVTANSSQTAALLARACDGGYPFACSALAGRYQEGKGVEPDEVRRQALLLRACDTGNLYACAEVETRPLPAPTTGDPIPLARRTAMPEPPLVPPHKGTLVGKQMTGPLASPEAFCAGFGDGCKTYPATPRDGLEPPFQGMTLIGITEGGREKAGYLGVKLASGWYFDPNPTVGLGTHDGKQTRRYLGRVDMKYKGDDRYYLQAEIFTDYDGAREDDPLHGLAYKEWMYCDIGASGRPSVIVIRVSSRSRAHPDRRVVSRFGLDIEAHRLEITPHGEEPRSDGDGLIEPGEYDVEFP